MRSIAIIVFICLATVTWAADPPVPADAQKILDQLDKDLQKLREKAAADLSKVVDKETKAGHLESAVALKQKVEALRAVPAHEEVGEIVIISAKYGTEGNWADISKFVTKKLVDGKGKIGFENDDAFNTEVGDPAPGATKQVVIVYRKGTGDTKTMSFTKHQRVVIE